MLRCARRYGILPERQKCDEQSIEHNETNEKTFDSERTKTNARKLLETVKTRTRERKRANEHFSLHEAWLCYANSATFHVSTHQYMSEREKMMFVTVRTTAWEGVTKLWRNVFRKAFWLRTIVNGLFVACWCVVACVSRTLFNEIKRDGKRRRGVA